MGDFPSGQRGQTVNLLATPSVVRIHHRPLNADVAQLAEQLICNQQVIGSSPIIGLDIIAGWSSLEARRAHNPKVTGSNPVPATHAQIAQLVEQRTENPRVAGSIPALGIFHGALAQSVEHLTFNQVVRGSNPRCFTIN